MEHSIKVGVSFGLTSGIITTLGLMVGLYAGTGSRLAVIGGVLTIALADGLSDALGIHISEESEGKHTCSEVWESTIATFLSKLVVALSFIVPILLLELGQAIIASIIWGILLLSLLSYYIAKKNKAKSVTEHIAIAIVVIVLTHLLGLGIARVFG